MGLKLFGGGDEGAKSPITFMYVLRQPGLQEMQQFEGQFISAGIEPVAQIHDLARQLLVLFAMRFQP